MTNGLDNQKYRTSEQSQRRKKNIEIIHSETPVD